MRFGVLGTLVVTGEDGQALRLGGPARRRLLAALVARVGQVVRTDTLIDDLWSDLPPATAEKTLQSHIVRLRDDLGRDDDSSPLVTEHGGYRLDVDPACVDAWCFEREAHDGRAAFAAGDLETASSTLDAALARWRGEAYAEFPDAVFAVTERLRLGELRSLAQECRTDVALALGDDVELVADLEARVCLDPYRERTWEQLMLALYRSGRQAEALAACRRARERLVDDLGVDPSPSMKLLEGRILDQDPALLLPSSPRSTCGRLTAAPEAHAADSGEAAARCPHVVGTSSPYRGLDAYAEDDADVFVGRERITAELAGRLAHDDLVVLVGASGVGKSSLIRAGLLPALRRGAIPGSAQWRTRVLTPTSADWSVEVQSPVDLVVVDQAEELFTIADDDVRRRVAGRLSAMLAAGTRLVLVLRADFYGRVAELDIVTGRIGSATELVGPLSEDETRRVVIEPAAGGATTVEPELVDRIIDDTHGRPGSLPLLSAALERAWARHTDGRLTVEDYVAGGGVSGALESMAETVYDDLDADQQSAARRILLSMVTRTGGVWTRRPVRLEDAAAADDAASAAALAALAQGRLVTVGVATAELAHEALLAGWPRLRAWLDDRALVADQLDFLASAASVWDHDGRPSNGLLRGPRLQAGLDWMCAHPEDLSEREKEFLASSRAEVEAALRRHRRTRRTLALATAWMAVAAVLATVGAGIAVREKSQADAASLSADARLLAAQSYTTPDIPTAMQLAAAAYSLQDSADTRGALFTAVKRESGVLFRLQLPRPLVWVGVPVAGGPILVVDTTGTASRIDPATRRVVGTFREFQGLVPVATSPDGAVLAVSDTATTTFPGSLYLFDSTTGVLDRRLTHTVVNDATTPSAAFTGDGSSFVVLEHRANPYLAPAVSFLLADTVAVYDPHSWLMPARTVSGPQAPTGVAASRDRIAISYADGTVEVRAGDDLRLLDRAQLGAPASDLALSPDGSRLAVVLASAPSLPQLLTVGRLSAPPVPAVGLAAAAGLLRFSPDGSLLSVVGADGSTLVLDGRRGTPVASTAGDGRPLSGAAWGGTASAPELLTVDRSGTLVSRSTRALPPTVDVGPGVPTGATHQIQCGDAVLSTVTLPDGSVRIEELDLRDGLVAAAWPVPLQDEEVVVWLAASGGGDRAALTTMLGGGRAHIRVWEMTTGRVLLDRSLRWAYWETPLTAGISSDGRTLHLVTSRSTVDLVDVASGSTQRTLALHLLGPDGSSVFPYPLPGGRAGTITFLGYAAPPTATDDWNLLPGHALAPVHEPRDTLAVVDDATGTVLATRDIGPTTASAWGLSGGGSRRILGLESGGLAEYDATTLEPLGSALDAHSGTVTTVSYSPEGSILVSAGTDGQVRLWDASTMRPLGTPTRLGVLAGASAWYRADGSVVGVMPSSHTDRQSDTFFTMPGSPAAWLRTACQAAETSLSPADWERYVGDRPYRSSCPDRSR